MEQLVQRIRKNKTISGVMIPGGGEVKCTLYMDDISVLVRDKLSTERVLKCAMEYCEMTG